ncbi:MAG: DUF5060 domain-containing protein, partial [Lentisphaerae bacterium]|nr:DUF5060 domain-containing protein [Lentisphaerota bacterium]
MGRRRVTTQGGPVGFMQSRSRSHAHSRLSGRPAGPCRINAIQAVSASVGLYEKLELRIDLDADFCNPFDPEEIDLQATFTAPSGKKWKIWGFYNPSSWAALWMVRFTPTETGTWHYVVTVNTPTDRAKSARAECVVTASAHPGFVGIAPNRRYLMHSDHTPFYGVGLWYNDNCELYNQGAITEADLDNLKKRGANFISFFPTTLETMGSGLGRYDENRCGRMDQLFDWCERRDMKISWNLLFHSHVSRAVWVNPRYRHNPYRLISSAGDFFGSAEVWEYQQKLFRY